MKEDDGEKYKSIAQTIKAAGATAGKLAYIFDTLEALAGALEYKAAIGLKTRRLYQANDKVALENLAKTDYVMAIERLEVFYKAFKKQWYIDNKGFGFEVQAARIGGLIRRLEDCKELLIEYANGNVKSIPELECEVLPPTENSTGHSMADLANNYRILSTTAVT